MFTREKVTAPLRLVKDSRRAKRRKTRNTVSSPGNRVALTLKQVTDLSARLLPSNGTCHGVQTAKPKRS